MFHCTGLKHGRKFWVFIHINLALVRESSASSDERPTQLNADATFASMPQPYSPLIVGVGFQKTGTSSLREALHTLGYRVGDNNHQVLWPYLHGNMARVLRKLRQFEAVEDNPWPLMYKDLDALMPGSKFILTVRDPERWYESVARHIGDLRDPMHEWIYGRGKGLPRDDKAHTLNVYNRHNESVMDHFKDRPDDLLVVDFTQGAGWNELCAFLGHPVPDAPFPHANDKRHETDAKPSLRRQIKVAKKRLKFAVQIAYLRAKGML